MTQKAALCKALLNGQVLSIMTGFKLFSVTNVPREVSRQVEEPFEVQLERTKKDFTSKYGQSVYYYEYRLLRTPENKPGIEKMIAYINEIEGEGFKAPAKRGRKTVNVEPKTSFNQSSLFDVDFSDLIISPTIVNKK